MEDQIEVLDVTMRTLGKLGYTVLAANSAQDAVNLSKQHPGPIHLLITDVVMPNMNGKDLATTLTAQMPVLKCLFMSGYTPNVLLNKGLISDGLNFISKPFSLTDLASKIRNVLEQ